MREQHTSFSTCSWTLEELALEGLLAPESLKFEYLLYKGAEKFYAC